MGHEERSGSIRESEADDRGPIVLAGGYTAGHVYPALAVAQALTDLRPGLPILFVGTADGIEAEIVPASGLEFAAVEAAPIVNAGATGAVRAVGTLWRGVRQARALLRERQARLVLGFGSYVSAGVVLAARGLGLRTAVHEANVVPGLANRVLGRLVERVYLGMPEAAPLFPAARTLVTGHPVRAELALREPRAAPSAGRAARVLVTGGSGGSPFLDDRAPALLARVDAERRLEVRHLTGSGDPAAVRARYADAGVAAEVVTYEDDMGAAYRWADLAVTRAGAGTLAELAATRLPALLVPLPGIAGDHQTVNAQAFAAASGVSWSSEADFDAQALAGSLARILGDGAAWSATSAAVGALARPDAARAVAEDLLRAYAVK